MTIATIEHSKINFSVIGESHDINYFDCGHNDLNEFLADDSQEQMGIMLNVTHICSYNDKIIGYITICADKIQTESIDKKYKDKLDSKNIEYNSFPAIKIGRFAVHKELQRNGVGTHMLKWVVRQSLGLSEKLGTRFITVDAYYNALDFYLAHYFVLWPSYRKKVESYKKIEKENPDSLKNITVPLYYDLY